MIKQSLFFVASLWMLSGCGAPSNSINDGSKGPSNGSSGLGSMSEDMDMDVGEYLKEKSWKGISLDLDKFLYDRKGSTKRYEIEMSFGDKRVDVLADCYYVSANYRLKEDEITFSRVSSPRPAIDLPSCKEFIDAENAVSNFFEYGYTVTVNKQNEVKFESTDIEASVVLDR